MFKKTLFLFLLSCSSNILAIEIDINPRTAKIWTSKSNYLVGDKIRIYTEFKNSNNSDLIQTIAFFDNDEKIGEKNIEIVAKKTAISWIDYKINNLGEHRLKAEIKKTIKDDLDEKKEISSPKIENLKIIKADIDTDSDGIPDSKDTDDDNDGYLDEEELRNGSNPKSKISTPKTKKVFEETKKVAEKTKEVSKDILEIFNEKRSVIEEQLERKIKENQDIILKKKSGKILNQKKEDLIQKYQKTEKFKNELEKNKKEIENISNVDELLEKEEKLKKEIQNIKNIKEKEIKEAAIYETVKEKFLEIQTSTISFWDKFWINFWKFFHWIFKSAFWTIFFIILLFWLVWKIIKKI